MIAAVLYNIPQYVDDRLEAWLRAEDVSWTSTEFLHAVRQINSDDVPDWRETYQQEDAYSWTTII
jgi:hypothetical protein